MINEDGNMEAFFFRAVPSGKELGKLLNRFSLMLQSSQLHQPEKHRRKGWNVGPFHSDGCEWPLPKELQDLFPLL